MKSIVGALVVVLFTLAAAAQDVESLPGDGASSWRTAEAIVSGREAALGRVLDPAYRRRLIAALSSRPSAGLDSPWSGGGSLAAQGGNPSGCGVPLGPATSV